MQDSTVVAGMATTDGIIGIAGTDGTILTAHQDLEADTHMATTGAMVAGEAETRLTMRGTM